MKIYANNNYDISIRDFADTDLWVRCNIANVQAPYYIHHVRSLPSTPDYYESISFPADWVDNSVFWSKPECHDIVKKYLTSHTVKRVSKTHVILPIDVLDTQEIYEILGIPL